MRIRRRPPAPAAPHDEKPYLVTVHAPGDQYHTFAMGPGDGVGVEAVRVDIHHDGSIHARPSEQVKVEHHLEVKGETADIVAAVERDLRRRHQRSGERR